MSHALRVVRWTAVAILTATPIVFFSGCADVITYSRTAREEGIEQYNRGDYLTAAGSFRNALRTEPRDYKSLYYLGASYENLRQYPSAIMAYKNALDVMRLMQANHASDRAMRAQILNNLGTAISKSPDRNIELAAIEKEARTRQSPEAYFVLAKVARYTGDPDSAMNDYNTAMILDPANPVIAREYGLYLLQINQPQKAEIPLRRAYALNQQDAEVADGLRRVGVVPGPAIKEQEALARPLMPRGPIPEVDWGKLNPFGGKPADEGSINTPPAPVAPPRD